MYAVKDKTWWAGIGTLTHSPLGAFCGIRSFFWQGDVEHIKQKISCFRLFLGKGHLPFIFRTGKRYHVFGENMVIQERSCPRVVIFEKTIFSDSLKKTSYFRVFFWRKIIFHLPPGGKIIFSGRRNIIFPNNTRKIIFQRECFGKTIVSGSLEKENMDFHAVVVVVAI